MKNPNEHSHFSISLDVPIGKVEPCLEEKKQETIFSKSQEVHLLRKNVDFTGSIENQISSDESSSVFNSENDKPLSRSSSSSKQSEFKDRMDSKEYRRHLRLQSAM